jgi:phosphoserine phosphatase
MESLKPFTLTILDSQSIALSGRVIIGVEIGLDPAHAAAIESDINEALKPKNFDVALELL